MLTQTNTQQTMKVTPPIVSTDKKCAYIHPDGVRCKGNSCLGSPFCFFHNPEVKNLRRDAQRRGGEARKKANERGHHVIESPRDVGHILTEAINEAVSLPNSAAKGRTIAALADLALKAFRMGEWHDRITALEERLNDRR